MLTFYFTRSPVNVDSIL